MPERVLRQNPSINVGFLGNEVYGSMSRFLVDIGNGGSPLSSYPSLVWRDGDRFTLNRTQKEPVFTDVDYDLIDATISHSDHYRKAGLPEFRLYERLISKPVSDNRIAIDIAHGCIKFRGANACTFCTIDTHGMPTNAVATADLAWKAIERAVTAGYSTLFVSADELPLTFPNLMLEMAKTKPAWWHGLEEKKRPVLLGFARADGLQRREVVAAMRSIGFRFLDVGIDAGDSLSLLAMNKPLNRAPTLADAEKLFEANVASIRNARDHGIFLVCGLVLGHIGMTPELLERNVTSVQKLLDEGKDVMAEFVAIALSPDPGSRDYLYLTNPELATQVAEQHGLNIADIETRQRISIRHQHDAINYATVRGSTILKLDYAAALMPDVTIKMLKDARNRVNNYAKKLGISPHV